MARSRTISSLFSQRHKKQFSDKSVKHKIEYSILRKEKDSETKSKKRIAKTFFK